MIKKSLIVFAGLYLLNAAVFAQPAADSIRSSATGLSKLKKYDFGISLGSEFTSVKGLGSWLTTCATPHADLRLTKRFRVSAGISIATTHYFDARSWYGETAKTATDGHFSTATLFVSGNYLVTDRLTLSGSAFKLFPLSKDPLPYNPFNPVSAKGAQGVDFRVGYRIGDHMHIEAGIRYTDGVNPFYSDPFGGSSFSHDLPFNSSGSGYPRW